MASDAKTGATAQGAGGDQPTLVQPGEDSQALSEISIGAHPRVAATVRRMREAGGLIGFLAGTWMALPTHGVAGGLLRGIIAGLLCQVVVWGAAVLLSKQFILAELRAREQELVEVARRRGANASLPPGS